MSVRCGRVIGRREVSGMGESDHTKRLRQATLNVRTRLHVPIAFKHLRVPDRVPGMEMCSFQRSGIRRGLHRSFLLVWLLAVAESIYSCVLVCAAGGSYLLFGIGGFPLDLDDFVEKEKTLLRTWLFTAEEKSHAANWIILGLTVTVGIACVVYQLFVVK